MAAQPETFLEHPLRETLFHIYAQLTAKGIETDPDGYILAWHLAQGEKRVDLLADPVFAAYLALIMPNLIARREYVSTRGSTYQIITQNREIRSNSYYYGPYKHRETDDWSIESDWGTQIDLEGCKIDGTHRANSGGTTVNLSSEGRATYLCVATGQKYIAHVNSGDGSYGWPHIPRGGGSVDSKIGLVNVGCAKSTRFLSAPDGQNCSDYSSTMPCSEVKIWVKTPHQQEFFRSGAVAPGKIFSARLSAAGAKSSTGLRATVNADGCFVEFPRPLPHADYAVHITVMPCKFHRTWGRTSDITNTGFKMSFLTEKGEDITWSSYPDLEVSVLVVL